MAISTAISQRELERVAQVAFEGKYLRISLASLSSQGYTTESTVSNWDSIKLSGNGYTDFIAEIETGAYDTTDARYETPQITAQFTASAEGAGLNYNRIYTVVATPSTATIQSASLTSNVATVATTATHGFTAGKIVIIEGFSNTVFNGTHIITTTPSPDSFTFAKTNANIGAVTSGGTATELTDSTYLHSLITESPAVILAPSQTVSYRIQVCTDD